MAEGTKRKKPKFSFSQFEQKEDKTVQRCKTKVQQTEEDYDTSKSSSIETLHTPVEVLSPDKVASICDKILSLSECKTDSLKCIDNIASENVQNISQAVKDVPKTSKILCHASDAQNVKEKHNVLQLGKTLDNMVKNYTNLQQKENKDMLKRGKRQSVARVRTIIGNQTTKAKILNTKSPKVSSQSSLMPHHKIQAKNKLFPIKECFRHHNDELTFMQEQHSHLGNLISSSQFDDEAKKYPMPHMYYTGHHIGRHFEHPKYNSIICITDKLKKLEQQKIVSDINHLPPLQKNLINRKISAALDHKLETKIYENLVDLTIDDKTLPPVVTRTKDPKPQEKDITPTLSDFFVPERMKEYCEAVHVKLRAPKIDENWNAFKISAKIREWRYNLDDLDWLV